MHLEKRHAAFLVRRYLPCLALDRHTIARDRLIVRGEPAERPRRPHRFATTQDPLEQACHESLLSLLPAISSGSYRSAPRQTLPRTIFRPWGRERFHLKVIGTRAASPSARATVAWP